MAEQTHIFSDDTFESMLKPGNTRAVLRQVLNDIAIKSDIEIQNYEKGYTLELYKSEIKYRANALLESIILLNLLKSNEEYLRENLKDKYKGEASDLKEWELFKKAEDFYNKFVKECESNGKIEIFNRDLQSLEASVNKTIKKVKNHESEEIVTDEDNFDSSSSKDSAPQTPEKNEKVQVEIKVDGSEEQDEDEEELTEEELKEIEKEKEYEKAETKNNLGEEKAKDIEEDKETEKDETKNNLEEEKAKEPTKDNETEGKQDELREGVKEEQKEDNQDEVNSPENDEPKVYSEKQIINDNKVEKKDEQEAENRENGKVAANLAEEKGNQPQDKVEDKENQSKNLFWNIFGAIFSGIGLGGSIAAGATIVLGVGALAALSGVGLILAGVAAATVGLVSLGTFIYNLVKIHKKKKLQNETKKENNDEGKEMKSEEILIEIDEAAKDNLLFFGDERSDSEKGNKNEDKNDEPVPAQEFVDNLNKGIDDSL